MRTGKYQIVRMRTLMGQISLFCKTYPATTWRAHSCVQRSHSCERLELILCSEECEHGCAREISDDIEDPSVSCLPSTTSDPAARETTKVPVSSKRNATPPYNAPIFPDGSQKFIRHKRSSASPTPYAPFTYKQRAPQHKTRLIRQERPPSAVPSPQPLVPRKGTLSSVPDEDLGRDHHLQ